jgi:benzoate membrane transport protein
MPGKLPPPASWSSALIASLIGFGGTVALIVQAMQKMGADAALAGSAVTALCLGIAVGGIALSLSLRMPIVLAWSTPGAALLAASTAGVHWSIAIGSFMAAALFMILLGVVPALGRLATRIPTSIASAMLAGVLLPFCMTLFRTLEMDALLVVVLLIVFLIGRQRFPLYALLLVLVSGILIVLLRGDVKELPPGAMIGTLMPSLPAFDLRAIVSLGLPLFLVTLVSQNLPGLVVLKSAGYEPSPRPILLITGLMTLLMAPFGAHGVNLAAITAAICTSDEAHPDRSRRWTVAVIYAACYLALALFSAPLVRLFMAMPHASIAALAGIALISPLSGAMDHMLATPRDRDAALLTFAATASGVTLWGIGSAFWGLMIGFTALGAKAILARKS